MKSGIICINKEQEWTSFDVVAKIRKKLAAKRVGHLGTLDPMAEGVLLVAVGKATRIMDYLDTDIKEYECQATLGMSSDTLDIWGETITKCDDVKHFAKFSDELIEQKVLSFSGLQEQYPPMYSAVKKNGKKLYSYARAGQTVDVDKRTIYVEDIFVTDIKLPKVEFKVRCTKGTYIRTICADLGNKLGTDAVMSGLTRTKSGSFSIENATAVSKIDALDIDELQQRIIPIDNALTHFGEVRLKSFEAKLFSSGVRLEDGRWQIISEPVYKAKEFYLPIRDIYSSAYRVYDVEGLFLGVGTIDEGILKADKVFLDENF